MAMDRTDNAMDELNEKRKEEESSNPGTQHGPPSENATAVTESFTARRTEDPKSEPTVITIVINNPRSSNSEVVISKCNPGTSVDIRHECCEPESSSEDLAELSLQNEKAVNEPHAPLTDAADADNDADQKSKSTDEAEVQSKDSIIESESVVVQTPINSPWGPPHEGFPPLSFLDIKNHNKVQAEVGDPCCQSPADNGSYYCSRFQSEKGNDRCPSVCDSCKICSGCRTDKDFEAKCCVCEEQQKPPFVDASRSSSLCDESEMSEAKCSHCYPCDKHVSPCDVENGNPCFVYPVFPMYCVQPLQHYSPTCCYKGGKGEELRTPLNMNVVSFPNPCHFNLYRCKSKSSPNVEDKGSQSCVSSNLRSAGLDKNMDDEVNRRDVHNHSLARNDTEKLKNCLERRPPTILCYICGKEYGTASINIHEKQCLERWRTVNNRLPEEERRPEPVKLPVSTEKGKPLQEKDKMSGKEDYDLSSLNKAAFESFQQQYVKCSRCNRTFLPDSLKLHSRGCRGFHKVA